MEFAETVSGGHRQEEPRDVQQYLGFKPVVDNVMESIVILSQSAYHPNEPTLNPSISAAAKGTVLNPWYGPVLVYRRNNPRTAEPGLVRDMGVQEYDLVVKYFKTECPLSDGEPL